VNPNGQEHFKSVVKAYEILCDNYKKSQYDYRLKSFLNSSQRVNQATKSNQTKTYDFNEAELKRRQYYQEHYKKQYEQSQQRSETVELKRSNNEFKNIIIATPMAVLLIMLILNVWRDKPEIKVVPYKEEVKPIKVEIEKQRKVVSTGDSPYADYYGGSIKDTISKRILKFKNMCGNDLILFLFNKNDFIRSCYVEHGYEVSLDQLPKEISLVRIMQGKNFEYIQELSKAGVFGAFKDSCKFYQYKKKLRLNGNNNLTIINFEEQGFSEVGEEGFFKKDG
jgi:curved DNA-binding protein CbpA